MLADPLAVVSFSSPPDGISTLLEVSLAEGHNLVERLVDDWEDGSNRFDQPGEVALGAWVGSKLVAVGGLNRDPYIEDADVGRIRHLYVSPQARGRGVGRVLVLALLEEARKTFRRVRLRTSQHGASELYLSLGFERIGDEPDATHVFWL